MCCAARVRTAREVGAASISMFRSRPAGPLLGAAPLEEPAVQLEMSAAFHVATIARSEPLPDRPIVKAAVDRPRPLVPDKSGLPCDEKFDLLTAVNFGRCAIATQGAGRRSRPAAERSLGPWIKGRRFGRFVVGLNSTSPPPWLVAANWSDERRYSGSPASYTVAPCPTPMLDSAPSDLIR